MEHLIVAVPWLMAAAAIVSAVAGVAAWRAVPWQGRQSVLVMAAAMLALAATAGRHPVLELALGVVLLGSGMVGTMGVRGTASAAPCCHRALVSLVMAMCAFHGAAGPVAAVGSATVTGHGGHGLSGMLSVLLFAGVGAVALWTIVAEWFVAPVHHGRTARLLRIESWAMTAGVAAMCLGF